MKKRILTLILGVLMVALALSFAACQKTEYTATFVADGQTVGERQFYKGDTTIAQPPFIPNKLGYTGAWESYTLGEENITINAVYTAIEYTATFKADNQVVKEVKFTIEDTKLDEPAVPEKSGFVNGMWESYKLKNEDFTVNALYCKTVSSVAELQSIEPSGRYVLTCDLNIAGVNWTPIGSTNSSKGFSGYFDGAGHVISGLSIKGSPAAGKYGLFSDISGEVKNLGLENVDIALSPEYGSYYAGALAAMSGENAVVSNCYSTGRVAVSGSDAKAGGLVAYALGKYERCYSEATVNAELAGGLFGSCGAEVTNCYATGNVSAYSRYGTAGGLIGRIEGTSKTCNIINCYALGNAYASSSSTGGGTSAAAGALVGDSMSSHNIENCFAIGNVSASTSGARQGNGDHAEAGAIIGDSTVTVKNSYYPEGQTVNCSAKQKYVSTEGTATALENLKDESFLKNTLKFSDEVWVFGADYPTLKK